MRKPPSTGFDTPGTGRDNHHRAEPTEHFRAGGLLVTDDPIGVSTWLAEAGGELASLQASDGGWPYIPGQASATESTALALLALAMIGEHASQRSAAQEWLAGRQQSSGLFSPTPLVDDAGWLAATAGLAMLHEGQTASSRSAADALLAQAVFTIDPPLPRSVYGYDTTLRGWPYSPGDFSLNEPTCMAMIFLKKAGYRDHARVREAAAMLRDRAIAGGGWNYGEPQVWGNDLFASVANTAMALAALADEQDERTAAGVAWLQARRGTITSLPSLGWAAIAMNVLGLLDDAWRFDVINTWQATTSDRRGPMETALCLLGLAEATNHPLQVMS